MSSTDPTPYTAPPGWYPDPHMPDTVRYFDGHTWTDHVAPTGAATKPKATSGQTSLLKFFLIAWGVFALVAAVIAVLNVEVAAEELRSEGNMFSGLIYQALLPRVLGDSITAVIPAGLVTAMESWSRHEKPHSRTRTVVQALQVGVLGLWLLLLF